MTSILFVVSNLSFPPIQGPHVQTVSLMKALRSRGYELSVLALVRNPSAFDAVGLEQWVGGFKLMTIIPNRLNYFLLTIRLLLPNASSSLLYSSFRKMIKELPTAILHLEGIGLAPLLVHTANYPTVMSTVDAWSHRQNRLARDEQGINYLILRFYAELSAFVERRFFPQASAVHVVSAVEAQWLSASLSELVSSVKIAAIPVAIAKIPLPRTAYVERLDPPVLVFWGDVRTPCLRSGLEWLFENVRPKLEALGIFAEWVIMGRSEPDDLLRILAGNASFLGWVDDVDVVLRRADVVMLPDKNGTGLKNRTIHAMACGVPVIGSPEAFEGFPVRDGVEAMVRSSPEQFTQGLLEVLNSPERANAIAMAGREFAINGYSLDAVVSRWEALYQEAINQPRSTS